MRKSYIVIFILIALFLLFTGRSVFNWMKSKDIRGEGPVGTIDGEFASRGNAEQFKDGVPVLLYFANKEGTKLVAERRYISKDAVTSDLATNIVKELLKGPAVETGLVRAIPNGTRLIGGVKTERGIATVDLSEEFISNLSKDKNADSLAIFSIVNSLSEIKEINKIRFTINGVIKSQVGKYIFNVPFQRSESLIDKNAEIKNTKLPAFNQNADSVDVTSEAMSSIEELTDEELEKVFNEEIDFFE